METQTFSRAREADQQRGGWKRGRWRWKKEGGFRPVHIRPSCTFSSSAIPPLSLSLRSMNSCFCLLLLFLPLFLIVFSYSISHALFLVSIPLLLSPSPLSALDSLSVTADLRDIVFLKLSSVWKQQSNVLVSVGLARSHSFIHTWSGLNIIQGNTELLYCRILNAPIYTLWNTWGWPISSDVWRVFWRLPPNQWWVVVEIVETLSLTPPAEFSINQLDYFCLQSNFSYRYSNDKGQFCSCNICLSRKMQQVKYC